DHVADRYRVPGGESVGRRPKREGDNERVAGPGDAVDRTADDGAGVSVEANAENPREALAVDGDDIPRLGSCRAGDIGGHDGTAGDREGERVQGVVLRRRPGLWSLESDESRGPGPGAGVGGDGGAVPAAGRLVEVLQVEGSRGVSRFRPDIRDEPPAVDGQIVHTADRYEVSNGASPNIRGR